MPDHDDSPSQPTGDPLAEAEEAAAREAAEAADAPGDPGAGKVSRPTARTVGAARRRGAKKGDGDADAAPATRAGSSGDMTTVGRHSETIEARSLIVSQAGIAHATADEVSVRQGAIRRLEARDVAISQGAVALARADRVSVELGAVGAAFARDASITQGAATTVIAREVRVGQSFVRTLIAGTVRFDRPGAALVLVARRVEGDVRVLLDWRGALVIGGLIGVLGAIFRRRAD
jgi:hypothetical protein